jgi:hypothetical protein
MSNQVLLEYRWPKILSEKPLTEFFLTLRVQVIFAELCKREFEGDLIDQLLKFWMSLFLRVANDLKDKTLELFYKCI